MLNRRKKILLVEDDSVAAVGISLPLIRRGYKVISRSSGAALEWLRTEVPDLVILDVAMTGRLGFEVSRRINENRATGLKPVIFLTAQNVLGGLREGAATESDAYVVGPFDGETLVHMVEVFLTTDIPLTKRRPAAVQSRHATP